MQKNELKYRYENDEKTVCKNRAIYADSPEKPSISNYQFMCALLHDLL